VTLARHFPLLAAFRAGVAVTILTLAAGSPVAVRADSGPSVVPPPSSMPLAASATATATASLRDDLGILDRVEVQIPSLPAPPAATRYRVWLRSEDLRVVQYAGDLEVPAGGGTATLSWIQPGAENLLATFSQVLVTLESGDPPGQQPGGTLLFQGQLDPGVLTQARRLLVRWPDSRYGSASLVGLRRMADLARLQVAALQEAAAAADLAAMQRKAEHLVNLVEGDRGAFYGDLNRDGRAEDPGDGTGILPYAAGAVTQARFAWAQAVDPAVADQALALEAPLRYVLEWAGFVRDAGRELAQTQDVAAASALAGAIADATARIVAGVDPRGDVALADAIDAIHARGLEPAYDQARALVQVPLAQPCAFVLGFGALEAQIPEVVGLCLEDQSYAPNGDARQRTTGGLLAWRKADNRAAFTDGVRTWVAGPDGLVSRPNTAPFSWETP
jgi:hypothetical protein